MKTIPRLCGSFFFISHDRFYSYKGYNNLSADVRPYQARSMTSKHKLVLHLRLSPAHQYCYVWLRRDHNKG